MYQTVFNTLVWGNPPPEALNIQPQTSAQLPRSQTSQVVGQPPVTQEQH